MAANVVAFSSLTDRPMTVELAEHVLKDVYPQGAPAPARGPDPALADTVGIDDPPPKGLSDQATTFAALDAVVRSGIWLSWSSTV